MKTSVLLVDDDRSISELVVTSLRQSGYKVQWKENVSEALEFLEHEEADIVLLDVQLPGISGFKMLEMLKERPKTARLPVIMLTVLGDEGHKVKGLSGGADDYLTKPFSPKELVARIEALMRRARNDGMTRTILEAGGIRVDADTQEVVAKGRRVILTKAEFLILSHFLKRKGFVLSYQNLAGAMCEGNDDRIVTSETLYTHIKNLRKKLGPAGDMIESIRGMGYKFVPR
jgi:DNA-binding response OmpR family regulator